MAAGAVGSAAVIATAAAAYRVRAAAAPAEYLGVFPRYEGQF